MRKRRFILTLGILFCFVFSNAQYNKGFHNYKEEEIKRWKVGLGWGFVGTNTHWLPKTLHVERRWNPHFRLNLGISHTKYTPKITEDESSEKENYFGLDVNFLYNFRAFKYWYNLKETWTLKNLHKEKMYFDGYFLVGSGLYNPIAIPTLNTGVGGDFWITYRWGVNVQTMAKWSMDANNRYHIHSQIGVVYHVDQGNDAGALDTLRRRHKRKKKPKPIIHEKAPESESQGESEEEFEDFEDF